MKIVADTNVLIRSVMRDDEKQASAAVEILKEAELIAVAIPCLCEFVWVLAKVYRLERADIAVALRTLLNITNLAVDRLAVEAGLSILEAGGDFADGVIAYEGSWLGGETFVSFDKKAVALLAESGQSAKLLT